jgi:hypothetical protein
MIHHHRSWRCPRLILVIAILCAVSPWARQVPAQPAPGLAYDQMIADSDARVRAGQYLEGFASAQQAIRLSPGDFRGHYYAAFALYKRDLLDQAAPYARDAVAKATGADRASAQKLVERIAARSTYLRQVSAGDDAAARGLFAKAAESYAKAFEAFPGEEQVGLKAAKLLAERVDVATSAAILVRLAESKDAEIARQASQLLQLIQPRLDAAHVGALSR